MTAPANDPVDIRHHAAENLRFIRDAMERAGSMTVIPGRGMAFIGITAIIVAWLAAQQSRVEMWLALWMGELALAVAIDVVTTLRKAKRTDVAVFGTPFRRFLFSFAVPMFVGGVLTIVFHRTGLHEYLPAMWLLLYGTAIVNGGVFSIRIVPIMGLSFIALGLVAVGVAPSGGDLFMAAGFGGLHIIFGAIIAGRYGG